MQNYIASSKALPISFLNMLFACDFAVLGREQIEEELIETKEDLDLRVKIRGEFE